MDDIEWKPLGLLYVEYPKGDAVGYVLAWTSMFPIFLCISIATLVVFKRDLHTISFAVGILVNEALNFLLKNMIKEYRPNRARSGLVTAYGMPSNHSQYMGFFSTYLILFLFIRAHHNSNTVDNLWKYAVSVCALVATFLTAYSRLYLGYHTAAQCGYGVFIGAVIACLWCGVVQQILTPLFPIIVSWRISEMFMLRDLTLIPNISWFEYTTQRGEARNRQRKQQGRKSS